MYTLIKLAEHYYYLAKQAYLGLSSDAIKEIRSILKQHYQFNGDPLFTISKKEIIGTLNSILPLGIKVTNHYLPHFFTNEYGDQICYLSLGIPSYLEDLPFAPIGTHEIKLTLLDRKEDKLIISAQLIDKI